MRPSLDRTVLGASLIAVLCGAVFATATAGGGEGPVPLALGTLPAEWTDPDGIEATALIPNRAPVSTLDGQILRDAAGAPVGVPLGEQSRGAAPYRDADAQVDAAMLLQAKDACERGIGYPIHGTASGDGTMEENLAEAKRNMEEALAANDGHPYRDACDVVEELKAQR